MKKVLFVATVVKHHIISFHIPYLQWFKQNGYETHVCAANDYNNKEECVIPYCDIYYDLPFSRFPFSMCNFTSYIKLKKIVSDNHFDIIHCHTPVGGALARLAARNLRKMDTKVIYTAHGFHFYKSASVLNWFLFYPAERLLARFTDILITINQEDYQRALKFKAGRIEYVPGVGLDIKRFQNISCNREIKRREMGISEDTFVILSVGELSKRKNHEVIIKALAALNIENYVYIICGHGGKEQFLKEMADDMNINVIFLGYTYDVHEVYNIADLFVFPSLQEGLPVALMEAMAAGLPIVCSQIRGNTDLIANNMGGYLVEPNDIKGFALALKRLINDLELREKMKIVNQINIEKYDIKILEEIIQSIYKSII